MKEVIAERRLKSGELARVVRITAPEIDGMRSLYEISSDWIPYYIRAMIKGHSEYIVDKLFYAEIDGAPVARLWYAWSKRSLHGNYGNIYTNYAHRQKGLLNFLLDCYKPDFDASPAKMLCCSASGYRIPVYEKYGFNVLHGNHDADAMGTLKPELGTFAEYTSKLYADCTVTLFREGNVGDQFDCDKCLVYTDAMWKKPFGFAFAGDNVGNFQGAINKVVANAGTCSVAENAAGAIVGYASALINPSGTAGFVNYCAYPTVSMDDKVKLIRHAVDAFTAKYKQPLLTCTMDKWDSAPLLAAGFGKPCAIPGTGTTIYSL